MAGPKIKKIKTRTKTSENSCRYSLRSKCTKKPINNNIGTLKTRNAIKKSKQCNKKSSIKLENNDNNSLNNKKPIEKINDQHSNLDKINTSFENPIDLISENSDTETEQIDTLDGVLSHPKDENITPLPNILNNNTKKLYTACSKSSQKIVEDLPEIDTELSYSLDYIEGTLTNTIKSVASYDCPSIKPSINNHNSISETCNTNSEFQMSMGDIESECHIKCGRDIEDFYDAIGVNEEDNSSVNCDNKSLPKGTGSESHLSPNAYTYQERLNDCIEQQDNKCKSNERAHTVIPVHLGDSNSILAQRDYNHRAENAYYENMTNRQVSTSNKEIDESRELFMDEYMERARIDQLRRRGEYDNSYIKKLRDENIRRGNSEL